MTGSPTLTASVVIPTHDKSRYLDLTLASYVHQTDPRFELVVVDDGSTDRTPEVIGAYARELPIRHVRQDNRGRAAARNAALRVAGGEVVVFSDDDRIVPASFVADHLGRFRGAGDDLLLIGPQRGILTRWVPGLDAGVRLSALFEDQPWLRERLPDDRTVQLVTAADVRERFAETVAAYAFDEFWWMQHCRPVMEAFPDLSAYALPWTLGTTGNMSTTRRLLAEAGPFDERFDRWGLEDTELCYRLTRAGARPQVTETAVSYHQAHPSSPRKFDDWNHNFVHFARKFDTIEVLLYLLIGHRRIHFTVAHEVVRECESLLRAGRPVLVEELTQRYRELAATLLPAAPGGNDGHDQPDQPDQPAGRPA